MDDGNSLFHYWSLINGVERRRLVLWPVVISLIITAIAFFGDTEACVDYCVDIVPVIASIIIGFLGMILIASLSKEGIFSTMRRKPLHGKAEGHSAYHLFFSGISANFILEMLLLMITLIIGILNSAFDMMPAVFPIELCAIMALLISTSVFFMNNIGRMYLVTVYDDA